jgi:uncharacterized iron-regulated membrane protein
VSINKLSRRLHYWGSFAASLPIIVILCTGILLQLKKQWTWVQPSEIRGTGTVPVIGLQDLITTMQTDTALKVTGWDDVSRVDIRADRGLAKITLNSGWEAQVDLGTGALLKKAYRRSDLIESLHDGSFFAGDWSKLGLFLPAGIVLFVLWVTGLWMFWVTWSAKRRRKASLR